MAGRKNFLLSITVILLLNVLIIGWFQWSPGKAADVYKIGSSGDAVKQIQQKLKSLGYYKGDIDGDFGPKTETAVISFQKKKGLTADGIVGPQTLKSLGITIKAAKPGTNDLYLLARIISAEGRGEPYNGQIAIGAVILNRVKHPSFPNSVSGVIYQPGAFTAVTDGQFDKPIADISRRAAQDVLNGVNPIGGAIYYYNPAKATNQWIRSRPIIKTIGKHVFCT